MADKLVIADSPNQQDYDFLTDEQWSRVIEVFNRDMVVNNYGFDVVAPSFPERGEEAKSYYDVNHDHMNWGELFGEAKLSERILASPAMDNNEELTRMIMSLDNTKNALILALAKRSK